MRQDNLFSARALALIVTMLAAITVPRPAAAFDDAALARQTYESIVLPGFARFESAARGFADKAEMLCAAPSDAALKATHAAARTALLAWGRIETIRFGPMSEKQRLERLLFYPDQHGIAAKQIAKLMAKRDAADIEPEKLAGASVAVQGFGAVDAVLFGEGAQVLATAEPAAVFRCQYLRALAQGIADIAREAHAEWNGAYRSTWLDAGPQSKTYLSSKETTQALYRAYLTELEVIRLQRLEPLLSGETKAGGPVTPPLSHSGLGLSFILANIEGARDLLGRSGFGAAALASTDKERSAIAILGSVATDLGFALRSGEAAIAMAPDPLANDEARARLAPALLSLKNAEETGRAALGELTGQALGFNSLDGD